VKDCTEFLALATERALSVLEPGDALRLDAHLAACSECGARRANAYVELATFAKDDASRAPGTWARLEERLREHDSVAATHVRVGSLVVLHCTFCHGELDRLDAVYCASCLAPHHGDCFAGHGRCSVPGCGERDAVRPKKAAPRPGRRGRLLAIPLVVLGAGAVAAVAARTPPKAPLAPAPVAPVSTEQAALVALTHDVEGAIRTHDLGQARLLIEQLEPLGRPGWPLVVRIALTFDMKNERDWAGPFSEHAGDDELRPLMFEAAVDAEHYPKPFRRIVVESHLGRIPDDMRARAVAQMAKEDDLEILGRLMWDTFDPNYHRPEAPLWDEFARALRAQPRAKCRREMVREIGWFRMGGPPDAKDALLRDLAANDPDRNVREFARVELIIRNPPARGQLLEAWDDPSPDDVFHGGDIIVKSNGKVVNNWSDVDSTPGVIQEIFRDGKLIEVKEPSADANRGGGGGWRFVDPKNGHEEPAESSDKK
jgi:hypothetical protein